jgi:hypothetical protein
LFFYCASTDVVKKAERPVKGYGMIGTLGAYEARYWHELADGRIQCDLCPRFCKLHDGQHAACFVRARQGDRLVLTAYGRASGFCLDPIEKKPLFHFLPGTPVLSFGTAGCNLACGLCQNWDISIARAFDTLIESATPQAIASTALRPGLPRRVRAGARHLGWESGVEGAEVVDAWPASSNFPTASKAKFLQVGRRQFPRLTCIKA